MGTHPIFESDFDCLTEVDSYSEGGCCRLPRVPLGLQPNIVMDLVIILALLLVAVFISFFIWKKSFKQKGSDILFVGLAYSGKTVLVSKLLEPNAEPLTQTSIRPNVAMYQVDENKQVQLVDIPGSDRLRENEIEKFKSTTRGIVFVVNSETVSKDIRDVAELMYRVLTDFTINSIRPKILIAANKQDATIAKAGVKIQEMLEKELTLLRKTQTAALKDHDDAAKTDIHLGKKGTTTFELSQLPMDVEVHECSGKTDDLDAIKSWIFSCAYRDLLIPYFFLIIVSLNVQLFCLQ